MESFNLTPSDQSTYILNGIPGLEDASIWISIPFSALCILSLLVNSIVIFVVSKEQTLHKPTYLLVCMLAITGIGLSTFFVSNALCFFWFNLKKITVQGCLTQVFFLNAIGFMHSAILVTMAFDRYVAICDPLRYTTILTNARIANLVLVGLMRAVLLAFLLLLFLKKLPFCVRPVIPHMYCEFTTLVKMSCANTRGSWMYSLVAPLVTIMSDLTFIGLSYVLIIRDVLKISSKKTYQKALNTCTTQICVTLMSYIPFLFYILTQTFGQGIPSHILIFFLNLVLLSHVLNPIIYGITTKEFSHKLGNYICRM